MKGRNGLALCFIISVAVVVAVGSKKARELPGDFLAGRREFWSQLAVFLETSQSTGESNGALQRRNGLLFGADAARTGGNEGVDDAGQGPCEERIVRQSRCHLCEALPRGRRGRFRFQSEFCSLFVG